MNRDELNQKVRDEVTDVQQHYCENIIVIADSYGLNRDDLIRSSVRTLLQFVDVSTFKDYER